MIFAPGRSPSLIPSRRATKAGDLMRKVFNGLLAAAAVALLFAMPAWSAADPGQFVKNVTGQLADIARTKSGPSRDAAVREVLRNNFDLAHMARVALGSHWAGASEPMRARFLAALEAADVDKGHGHLAALAVPKAASRSLPRRVTVQQG